MNIVLLFGRLTSDVEIIQRGGRNLAHVTLACRRDFKNSEGEYDTDFIHCTLWEGLATYAQNYCRKGMAIILKGRLVQNKVELDNGKSYTTSELVGEMISCIPYEKNEPGSIEL